MTAILGPVAAATIMIGAIIIGVVNAPRPRRANKAAALTFQLPGIAPALARQEGITIAEALRREREFRRWFTLAAASPVMLGMGSAKIDAYWHLLLQNRTLYERYSRAVCGRVIGHVEGVGGERLDARSWAA